ncbi:MAG TPA: BON domain-containing protein [Pirellulales bacterium]
MSHRVSQGHPALPVSKSAPEAALARLRGSSYAPLRRVRCEFVEGDLVLRGRLATFFHKQLAQELVAKVNGVERVVNQIEVVNPIEMVSGTAVA